MWLVAATHKEESLFSIRTMSSTAPLSWTAASSTSKTVPTNRREMNWHSSEESYLTRRIASLYRWIFSITLWGACSTWEDLNEDQITNKIQA